MLPKFERFLKCMQNFKPNIYIYIKDVSNKKRQFQIKKFLCVQSNEGSLLFSLDTWTDFIQMQSFKTQCIGTLVCKKIMKEACYLYLIPTYFLFH